MLKWIGAFIGVSFRGFPGAVIGFVIGALIDWYLGQNKSKTSSGNYSPFSGQAQRVSPGDFELNLLSLCSIIIKADGKVSQNELNYVRSYFVQAYGKEKANAIFRTFNEVVKNRKVEASRICAYLQARTAYEVRLQILHFLFGIAMADGTVSQSELDVLKRISGYLNLTSHDFESIKAMFFRSADESYKILEIEKDASETEIKKAYRTMVKKYHPDKLTHMDEAYRKGAREKFNRVQDAYEKIRGERGFK